MLLQAKPRLKILMFQYETLPYLNEPVNGIFTESFRQGGLIRLQTERIDEAR